MPQGLKQWWRGNGHVTVIIGIQLIFLIIWGVKLEGRVSVVENRVPLPAALSEKINLLETRQTLLIQAYREERDKLRLLELKTHSHP